MEETIPVQRRRRRRTRGAAFAVALLAVAGCGPDSDPTVRSSRLTVDPTLGFGGADRFPDAVIPAPNPTPHELTAVLLDDRDLEGDHEFDPPHTFRRKWTATDRPDCVASVALAEFQNWATAEVGFRVTGSRRHSHERLARLPTAEDATRVVEDIAGLGSCDFSASGHTILSLAFDMPGTSAATEVFGQHRTGDGSWYVIFAVDRYVVMVYQRLRGSGPGIDVPAIAPIAAAKLRAGLD